MHTQAPTPEQAAAALALAQQHRSSVAKPVIAVRVAMAGFAMASAAALLIMGLVDGIGSVIGSTAMLFGAIIALLTVAAPAQKKVREKNFTRRYLVAILSWGVIYAATVWAGISFFPGAPLFWIAGAVLSAVPAAWFALSQASATR